MAKRAKQDVLAERMKRLEREPWVKRIVAGATHIGKVRGHNPGDIEIRERHAGVENAWTCYGYGVNEKRDFYLYTDGSLSQNDMQSKVQALRVVDVPLTDNGTVIEVDRIARYTVTDAQVRFIDVTPDLAFAWLDRNTTNRPVRQRDVERYAETMKRGQWNTDSPQGLIFHGNPFTDLAKSSLMDGQHRLWAVINAGVTQRMAVAINAPLSVRDVLDSGVKRTDLDVYRMTRKDVGDYAVTNAHVAVARKLLFWGRDLRPSAINRDLTFAVLEQHGEAIARGVAWIDGSPKGIDRALVATTMARAFYHVLEARLDRLSHILRHGMAPDPEPADQTAVALRDLLMSSSGLHGAMVERSLYLKTQRAVLGFSRHEVLPRRHIVEAAGEFFPIEGDTVTPAEKPRATTK